MSTPTPATTRRRRWWHRRPRADATTALPTQLLRHLGADAPDNPLALADEVGSIHRAGRNPLPSGRRHRGQPLQGVTAGVDLTAASRRHFT
ncbi:hypothetical protein [Pilimelia anulata]|uniref:hypothetical protein n=1 Tax=Pilimelia anulata TaxID=53371 RepID=UPI001668AAB8|nr:hypothetical protein [Pilimelia anulata]